MDRIETGITGLDDLIGGGIPEGSTILLTGSCGTGKSILSLQYIYNGAVNGEPGLYITFEETREKIIEHSREFNMDIPSLEEKNLLEIYQVDTDDMGTILANIKDRVGELKAKRLVVDSLTTMMEHGVIYRSQISREMSALETKTLDIKFPDEGYDVTRKDIYFIVGQLNMLGTTAILISEVAEKSNYLSRDTISEFACDGVILLEINTVGGCPERLLSVKKMRGTPVDLTMSTMKFGPNGIEVGDERV
jgi:circadian clock protein KaiC